MDGIGLGLARGTVRLVSHDPNWSHQFAAESDTLQRLLGVDASRVEHVGSTAIPGIVAKPIIDIAILVDDLTIAEEWQIPLKTADYWYKGIQPDMPDRRFFAKGPDERRTVYLHLVNNEEFSRLIKFRDILRQNSKRAKDYAGLKQKLAIANPDDRADYSKRKNDFIQGILAQ
jgi:GrpB-like predicted nucleotidyltransferase (UPF0157 family)